MTAGDPAGPGADPAGQGADPGGQGADPGGATETAAVRIRGIYATALTRLLLDADHDVVQPSPPIRGRVDAALGTGDASATVETTDDRQGVGVSGEPAATAAVARELDGLAPDTVGWTDPAPSGAVVRAIVQRQRGSGTVLDLGEREGWLPDGAASAATADGPEAGDELVVQVTDPRPPWGSGRTVVDTELSVPGTLVSLVRDADAAVLSTPPDADKGEFARIGDLLDASVPDGWGVRWERPAAAAAIGELDAALDRAAGLAASLDAALDAPKPSADVEGADAPSIAATPLDTRWRWFGRESRFALDAVRAAVTTTMAGHHRVKAGAAGASDAVDFAERLGAAVDAFPTAAVLEQFGPAEGDTVSIRHGKPDGRRLTLGRGEVIDVDADEGELTVRRELTSSGTYDGLGVAREAGDTATTTYVEGRRWAPTVYRSADGELRGTYVNVSTPVELFPSAVRYLDLHVDVVKLPDGTVEILDEAELAAAEDAGRVRADLADGARDVARRLADALG